MSTISSSDLAFKYSWSAIHPDDPRVTGRPDSVLLNRSEGYEVLSFINRFCVRYGLGLEGAKKAERLLHLVPGNVRSQTNVQNWIAQNWTVYH